MNESSQYRIVTNGIDYKIEQKMKLKFWQSVPRWRTTVYHDPAYFRYYRDTEFSTKEAACQVLAQLEEQARLQTIRDKAEWKEVTCRTL